MCVCVCVYTCHDEICGTQSVNPSLASKKKKLCINNARGRQNARAKKKLMKDMKSRYCVMLCSCAFRFGLEYLYVNSGQGSYNMGATRNFVVTMIATRGGIKTFCSIGKKER